MIGIIAAMELEIKNLKKVLEISEIKEISKTMYYKGKYKEKDIILACCGVGKVNAAICTQTMILEYSPEFIINTGVGGALDKSLKELDVVIGTYVVQHDFDITALGEEKGLIPIVNKVKIPCDKKLVNTFIDSGKEINDINCKTGIIATGDQFISDKKKNNDIRKHFNASVCEMEGAAIGQVCNINNTNFIVLRSISDSGDENAVMDFPTFAKKAANHNIKLILKVLDKK